jgi:hypothetical protein
LEPGGISPLLEVIGAMISALQITTTVEGVETPVGPPMTARDAQRDGREEKRRLRGGKTPCA